MNDYTSLNTMSNKPDYPFNNLLNKWQKYVLTTVVYTVQMIPVENKDIHIFSPVAKIKIKIEKWNICVIMVRAISGYDNFVIHSRSD